MALNLCDLNNQNLFGHNADNGVVVGIQVVTLLKFDQLENRNQLPQSHFLITILFLS